ncbi:hypothetical protein Tco_0401214 [Tanacetum coccineum]
MYAVITLSDHSSHSFPEDIYAAVDSCENCSGNLVTVCKLMLKGLIWNFKKRRLSTRMSESVLSRMQFRIRVIPEYWVISRAIGVQNIGNGNVVAARAEG